VISGHVNIELRLTGVAIGSTSGVALIGDHITVDAVAFRLDSLLLEIAPTSIALSQAFGGCDKITVESASLAGGPAFGTTTASGVPGLFTAAAGPLAVDGSWGATDSTGVNLATSGNPINFSVLSLIAHRSSPGYSPLFVGRRSTFMPRCASLEPGSAVNLRDTARSFSPLGYGERGHEYAANPTFRGFKEFWIQAER
jgi:hypothetical protein